jgi:hypothetical protein
MHRFQSFPSFLIPSEKKSFLVESLTNFARRTLLERIVTADETRVLHYEPESTAQSFKSRDSSVGIALGYGLDDRSSRARFPARAGNFSLHHRVHNGSGAHPACYPMGTTGSFLRGKAAAA